MTIGIVRYTTMSDTQRRLFELPLYLRRFLFGTANALGTRIALDRHGPAEAHRLSIGLSEGPERPRDEVRSSLIPHFLTN